MIIEKAPKYVITFLTRFREVHFHPPLHHHQEEIGLRHQKPTLRCRVSCRQLNTVAHHARKVTYLFLNISREELSSLYLFSLPCCSKTLLVLLLVSLKFSAKPITSLGDDPFRTCT